MKITEHFIRKPVMTTLVILAMVFFGMVSYNNLPISYLPDVEFPTLQVTAQLPGGSPSIMASTMATPLEKQFTTIPGLISMSSQNTFGQTQITLQFELGRNIDGAASDTQAMISKAQGNMPMDQMPQPPYYEKVNPADDPVIYLAVSSDSLPLYTVNDYANTYISDTISMVNGVSQVLIYGDTSLAVRVKFDPDSLAMKDIGLNELSEKVSSQNVMLPVGSVDGKYRSMTLEATGQLKKAEEFSPMVIAKNGERLLRLQDVANVRNTVNDDKVGVWYKNKRCITMAVKKQPGSNTIAVVDKIKELLPTIRKQIPASIQMEVVYDRADYIKEAVDDVIFTLKLAVGLVVIVVLFFLRNFWATIIAGVAIPVSIIFTFAIMYVMGYSLDTLSLLALTLSVGFVVDDAIVVIENVVSHLEKGKKPFQAAIDGSSQITFTIISMTLSLVVVFIPIMFMAGIIGRILREFAMTITIAILASGMVSLSMTPMLLSRFMKPGKSVAGSDKIFDAIIKGYSWTLHHAMKVKPLVMLLAAGILTATIYFFMIIPKGFLPTDDMSYLIGFSQAVQGISYNSMKNHTKDVAKAIQTDPNVRSVMNVAGYPVQNQGFMAVFLKPPSERKVNADKVAMQLMGPSNSIPGVLTWIQNPPMIRLSAKQTKNLYMYTIQAPDPEELFSVAHKFQQKLMGVKSLTGVTSDMMVNNPELWVDIDRDKAANYGLNAQQIEEGLGLAYAEGKIGTIYGNTDQFWLIMQAEDHYKKDYRNVRNLYLKNSDGDMVRLDEIADFTLKPGPMQVNHTGQLPSVTYSFNLAEGAAMSQATASINKLATQELPATFTNFFEGEAGEFQKSMSSVYFLLLIAVAVIYMILGILYESFIHPITIISGLPSAAIGGLLTLEYFGLELDLFGMVGIIMLIGIVKKNAIMVVDFALEAEKEGRLSPEDAACEGSLERFRPIMMTTLAAIAGIMPIALGYGAGAQARQPMGLAIVGGLMISQVVTLYLTPVFYVYMDKFQRWTDKRGKAKRELMGIPEKDE